MCHQFHWVCVCFIHPKRKEDEFWKILWSETFWSWIVFSSVNIGALLFFKLIKHWLLSLEFHYKIQINSTTQLYDEYVCVTAQTNLSTHLRFSISSKMSNWWLRTGFKYFTSCQTTLTMSFNPDFNQFVHARKQISHISSDAMTYLVLKPHFS